MKIEDFASVTDKPGEGASFEFGTIDQMFCSITFSHLFIAHALKSVQLIEPRPPRFVTDLIEACRATYRLTIDEASSLLTTYSRARLPAFKRGGDLIVDEEHAPEGYDLNPILDITFINKPTGVLALMSVKFKSKDGSIFMQTFPFFTAQRL